MAMYEDTLWPRAQRFALWSVAIFLAIRLTSDCSLVAEDVPPPDPAATGSRTESGDQNVLPLEMDDLIANVAANEALYENIELVLAYEYLFNKERALMDGEVTHIHSDRRFILQNELAYFEDHYHDTWFRQEEGYADSDVKRMQGFDGEVTRLVQGEKIANVIDGRQIEPAVYQPHGLMSLISDSLNGRRMSEFLAAGPWEDHTLKNSIVGRSVVDGIECVQVRSEWWFEGDEQPYITEEFDFAPSRNYIPLRIVEYRSSITSEHPKGSGIARESTEIGPGMWFPMRVAFVSYRGSTLRDDEPQLAFRETYQFSKVELDPSYPISQFRDIPFPEAAAVYHVNSEGEITKSYQKNPHNPEGSEPRNFTWLLVVNGLALLAFAVWMLLRRKQHLTPHTERPN